MQQIGRYAAVAPIGAGGFGTVWFATDPVTGSPVAIKVLDWPDQDGRREMFRQEVSALLSVDHPNVVRVRDVIDQPGLAAIVTDYVEGVSLRRLLTEQGPLDGPQALAVLTGALRGLAAVHAAGLVHADLKPDNVLLDRRGTSRLIDFGLTGPPRLLSGPDTWIGTPAYLAPEVVLGQHIDRRSDLYAVAAMLFELLVGRPPYVGPDPVATAHLQVQSPVPDLRQWVRQVGDGLAALCAQDLAKDPTQRHQNATAFLASLDLAAASSFGPAWAGGAALTSATSALAALVGPSLVGMSHAGAGLLGAAPAVGPLAASAMGAAGFVSGVGGIGAAGAGLAGSGGAGAAGLGATGAGFTGAGFTGAGFTGAGAAGAGAGVTGVGAAGAGAGAGVGAGVAGAGSAGAAGAAGAGTLGGAAAAGAGGSGVAGAGGGAFAAIGGAKAAVAAVAAVAAISAGAATVVAINDEDEPTAPTPFEPALLAAYTVRPTAADGTGTIEAFVLRNDGSTVKVRSIGLSIPADSTIRDVQLASDAEGRSLVAADGTRIAAVSGTDPTEQSTIDCACLGVVAAPDGSFVALTEDLGIDRFRVEGGTIERISSTPITGAPTTNRADPNHLHAAELLAATADAAILSLPGEDDGFYFHSVLTNVDLASGAATELTDLGISYVDESATSASGRYLAMSTGPGDGCAYAEITLVDLARVDAGDPIELTTMVGPDGFDEEGNVAGGSLSSLVFEDEDLVAGFRTGDICGGGTAEPGRIFRTTPGALGRPGDPASEVTWTGDGTELGVAWRAVTHDGRTLRTWDGTGGDRQLWIGDPENEGTEVARGVGHAIRIGEPGVVEPPVEQVGTRVVDIDPWFADGTLKPGYTIEDRYSDYTTDCSYDSGSPVSRSAGTHWCGSTADYTYACWNDPTSSSHMLCLSTPWDRAIQRVAVTNLRQDTPAHEDPSPYGIELDDGSICSFRIGGAWGATPPGTLASYGCTNGWILLSPESGPDFEERTDGTWYALAYHGRDGGPEDQEAPQRVAVRTAYWMVAN